MKILRLFTLISCILPLRLWAQPSPFGVDEVFLALVKAYPDAVQIVPARYNKRPFPALLVRYRLFYWVQGRILPAEELDRWESYAPEDFYFYPKTPADPSLHTRDWLNYLEDTADLVVKKTRRPSACPEIWNTLYQSTNRRETEARMKTGQFFKRLVVMHERAWAPLKKVEAELMEKAKNDFQLAAFLKDEFNTVYSFYWRVIARSSRRSTHSYGISVDTLNRNNKKKATYWLWRRIQGSPWASEPLSVRWSPPDSFIETFEKYGFAWGGKWNFYDTIHFEYRPDILILNGYQVTPVRSEDSL